MNARIIALTALLASCGGDVAPLVASDVRISQPLPGARMSSGYLTLTNNSQKPITITEVTSPQFDRVEMHESLIEDGVARMVGLGDLTIPGNESIVFEPGGKHLMLMMPDDELGVVTLEFRSDDTVALTVDVTMGD